MQKKRILPLTAIIVAILLATTGMSVITARFLDNGNTTATTATEAAQIVSTSAESAKPPVVLTSVAATEPAATATVTPVPGTEPTVTPVPATEPTAAPVPVTEPAPTTVPVVTPTPVPDVQLISLEDAIKIALAQVGADAVVVSSELDKCDYPPEYEFKITAGGFKYEIDIHAITGAVISLDKEDGADCQKPAEQKTDKQKADVQKPGNQRFGSQRAIDQRSAQAAGNIPYANSQGFQKSTSCR